ncbi:MAG: hypothetical protein WA160_09225 [Pseudobdellovibrio sp.]
MSNEAPDIPLELKIKYIERRKKDLLICDSALIAEDYKFFERIGHDLKGNAITFGHSFLATLGEELELAAKAKKIVLIKDLILRYSDYIANL